MGTHQGVRDGQVKATPFSFTNELLAPPLSPQGTCRKCTGDVRQRGMSTVGHAATLHATSQQTDTRTAAGTGVGVECVTVVMVVSPSHTGVRGCQRTHRGPYPPPSAGSHDRNSESLMVVRAR